MSEQTITIQLPQPLHDRLQLVAEASGWSIEETVVQSVKIGMPPSLQKVPAQFHDQLLALNKRDDQGLWEVVQGDLDDIEVTHEAEKAGLATLYRAYAFALLKWRGHPVPDPAEILL